MDMASSSSYVLSSALSPKVRDLICNVGITETSSSAMLNDGILDWSKIEDVLPGSNDSPEYFLQCVEALASTFHQIYCQLESMTNEEFMSKYDKWLGWTGNNKLIYDCFSLLQESCNGSGETSGLILTATLERSLGNVYLMKGAQCPNMLKDLLLTEELKDIFGEVPLQFLRILIGPPISLNLRNIVWHGFCSPGEIHKQYWYTLLIVFASLGYTLDRKGIAHDVIVQRPYCTCPQFENVLDVFLVLDSDIDISDLINGSDFVVTSMKGHWHQAVQFYRQKRYGHCTALLLPQLEHSLRCKFAVINNCPERIVTAESTVLYTTFDEILCKDVSNGAENKLRQALGDGFMNMLHDLMVYREGPRLRDRISHGQCEFMRIGQSVASFLFSLCLGLCCKFKSLSMPSSNEDFFQNIFLSCTSYSSRFHPMALLKKELHDLSRHILQLKTVQWPDASSDMIGDAFSGTVKKVSIKEVTELCCQTYENILPGFLSLQEITVPFSDLLPLHKMLQRKLTTLYRGCVTENRQDEDRSVNELEAVVVLRQIVQQCKQTISQVNKSANDRFLLWQGRQLRSRQRSNYLKQSSSIPMIDSGIRLVAVIVTCHLYCLTAHSTQKSLKFLKKILQCCENLVTFTSKDKNKWDESCIVVKAVLELTQAQYNLYGTS